MKRIAPALVSAVSLLGGNTQAFAESAQQPLPSPLAQIPAPSPHSQQPISATKRSLIFELLELTGGQAQYEQMNEITFAAWRQQLQPTVEQMVRGRGDLSPEEEQAAIDRISVNMDALMVRVYEVMKTEITYEDVLEQVYYPIYDQYFTEEDLRNLIAFYRTPTGARLVAVSPELFQTSLRLSNDLFMPRILETVNQWMRQQFSPASTPATKP